MSQSEKVEDRPSDSENQAAPTDGVAYDEAGMPVCPSSTTERKLMWKIDMHVIPWLCIMYLLAFLGMCHNVFCPRSSWVILC
jgi:hypothetical protein